MTKWISVKDKYPPKETPVYLYGKAPFYMKNKELFGVGILTREPDEDFDSPVDYWLYADFEWTQNTYPAGSGQADLEDITHWMPLPNPPNTK